VTKRMQVKFGELSQEIAIIHGISEATVELILNAYSAAVRRLVTEGLIVEIARDLRIQEEDYFDPRNNKPGKRVVVNHERSRLRRRKGATTQEIEKEHERTAERIENLNRGDGL